MSQWTHVAGLIRVDNLGECVIRFPRRADLDELVRECITEKLGNTTADDIEADTWAEDWEKCTVPCGSEGSLQYRISDYADKNGVAWGDISIWGDLRDFGKEDYPELKRWFWESCEKLSMITKPDGPPKQPKELISNSFSIRNAVLLVDVEFQKDYVLVWNDETKTLSEHSGYLTKKK